MIYKITSNTQRISQSFNPSIEPIMLQRCDPKHLNSRIPVSLDSKKEEVKKKGFRRFLIDRAELHRHSVQLSDLISQLYICRRIFTDMYTSDRFDAPALLPTVRCPAGDGKQEKTQVADSGETRSLVPCASRVSPSLSSLDSSRNSLPASRCAGGGGGEESVANCRASSVERRENRDSRLEKNEKCT